MELIILLIVFIILYSIIMSRGKKKGRIKHYQPDPAQKQKIEEYAEQFSNFCINKTLNEIIDEYCIIFKSENKRRIKRQYSQQELNQLFTIKEQNDDRTV